MKPNAALKSRNTNFLVIASRPATSLQPDSLASAALRASPVSFSRAMKASSRGQGIIRFYHIRPAADRGARREQHEARDAERRTEQRPARRKILGDVAARDIAQPRQGDMRRELAALRLEAEALHQPFELSLQLDQRLDRLDPH